MILKVYALEDYLFSIPAKLGVFTSSIKKKIPYFSNTHGLKCVNGLYASDNITPVQGNFSCYNDSLTRPYGVILINFYHCYHDSSF